MLVNFHFISYLCDQTTPDYEQQRLQLLHKHGIDLENSNGLADGRKTRRMDRKEVELLMGGEGQGGIFTWRERNRRKVCSITTLHSFHSLEPRFDLAGVLSVSARSPPENQICLCDL